MIDLFYSILFHSILFLRSRTVYHDSDVQTENQIRPTIFVDMLRGMAVPARITGVKLLIDV